MLSPDVQLVEFETLFSTTDTSQNSGTQLILTSYVNEGDTIPTSELIAGTYVCQATNTFGEQQSTVVVAITSE